MTRKEKIMKGDENKLFFFSKNSNFPALDYVTYVNIAENKTFLIIQLSRHKPSKTIQRNYFVGNFFSISFMKNSQLILGDNFIIKIKTEELKPTFSLEFQFFSKHLNLYGKKLAIFMMVCR